MKATDYPAVDDHVVAPESGTEMINGQVMRVMPADPPHADEQCQIAYVIRPDVAPGYVASTELLTRVDANQNFATDACIRKRGINPETGSRFLEEISFEVAHTQTVPEITDRASMLIERGVRRVFAIHVREDENRVGVLRAGPVREWVKCGGTWSWIDKHPMDSIEDPCLVHPIKVQALLDAAEADNHVARVLLARNNPVIVADRRKAVKAAVQTQQRAHRKELLAREAEHEREMQARDERERQRLRTVILDFCDLLGVVVTSEQKARMVAMTSEELDALRGAIRAQRQWPEQP